MQCDTNNTGIKVPDEPSLSICPNPASNIIVINLSSYWYYKNIFITSLIGQPLITCRVIEAKTTLDISALPSGVYLVKIVGKDGEQVGKFIKE